MQYPRLDFLNTLISKWTCGQWHKRILWKLTDILTYTQATIQINGQLTVAEGTAHRKYIQCPTHLQVFPTWNVAIFGPCWTGQSCRTPPNTILILILNSQQPNRVWYTPVGHNCKQPPPHSPLNCLFWMQRCINKVQSVHTSFLPLSLPPSFPQHYSLSPHSPQPGFLLF